MDYTYNHIHPVDDLVRAYSRLSDRSLRRTAPAVERFEPIVATPVVSVTSKIFSLLKGIIRKNIHNIHTAFTGMKSRSEAVATFLAILELVRAHRITVDEKGAMEVIRKERSEQ